MTDVTQTSPVASVRVGAVRRLAIVVSMLLVLAAAAASLFLVRTVDNQLIDIGNTYEVRRQARELVLALVDAETGQRGYLLTQDSAYLAPYDRAVTTIDSTYAELLRLVSNNPSQKLRLAGLETSLAAKRAEMGQTIAMMSTGDVANAMALLRSDEGKRQMDTIRSILRTFIAEEDARLIERNSQMEGYRQLLVIAILAALGAAATLAYALFTRAQQQVAQLALRENQLLLQNEELEEHVRARTAEVEEARGRAERERARLETLEAMAARGCELTRDEIAAFVEVDVDLWSRAAAKLQSRLQRCPLRQDTDPVSRPH